MWCQIGCWVQRKGSVSAECPLLDYRLPTSGCILTWQNEGWRAAGVSLIRALSRFTRAHPHDIIITTERPYPYHTGIRVLTYGLWGTQTFSLLHWLWPSLSCPGSYLSCEPGSPAISPFLWPNSHPSGQTWFLLFSTSKPVGSTPNKWKTLTKWD